MLIGVTDRLSVIRQLQRATDQRLTQRRQQRLRDGVVGNANADSLALFVRDKTGSVRGEMLARTIDVILDFAQANTYGENFVRCEVVTHEGYGVPREIFPDFFAAIADVLRDVLGADWSPEMERGWAALLSQLGALCPPQ